MQALWMLVASAMFAMMGSSVKLATEHGASLPQIVLFRGFPSVILLLLWARAGRQSIVPTRSEEHTSELQSLMRISYAVFCLKKKKTQYTSTHIQTTTNEH